MSIAQTLRVAVKRGRMPARARTGLSARLPFVVFVTAFGTVPAHAQLCGNYDHVIGWIGTFAGSTSGTSGGDTVTESESATVTLAPVFLPSALCSGSPPPVGPIVSWDVGAAVSNLQASVSATLTSPCATGGSLVRTYTGSGNPFLIGGSGLAIDFGSSTYSFYVGTAVSATEQTTDCSGTKTSSSGLLPVAPGAVPPMLALPPVTPDLSGNQSFQAAAPPSSNLFPWSWAFTFSPIWDDETDKVCKSPGNSTLGCQNQSLGEDVPVVGTGLYLHYQSDRVAGRAAANSAATAQSKMIGGWMLSVHHRYDPTFGRLYLGSGDTRSGWQLSTVVTSGTSLLVTSEDGSQVYVFDSTGKHLQTLTPLLGAVIYQFGYDAAGDLVTVTDGSGNVTTIQRDASENAMAIVSPFSQTTTLTHDANGYLSSITDPAGLAASFAYDVNGLMLSRTDPREFVYHYGFDSFGRLISDSDPAGASTTVSRTDSLSLVTSTSSTPQFFTVTKTDPMGQKTMYQPNLLAKSGNGGGESGNVTWPNGLVPTYSRTQQAGQLAESKTVPDGTADNVTSGPDPRWGLQEPVPVSGTYTRGTHVMNTTASRTVSVSTSGNPFSLISQNDTQTINGRTYTSAFTAATKTNVDTSPAGRTTTTLLDSLERVSSVQQGGVLPVQFSYDSQGRLASVTQGQRSQTLSYGVDGFLASATNGLNQTVAYTRDADGRVLSTQLPDGRTTSFAYDADGNLTSVTPPGAAAHTFVYTNVNELASYTPPSVIGAGATSFSYDASRRLTGTTRPDGSTVSYSYDTSDRLTSTTTPTETRTFTYDAATGNLIGVSSTSGESIAYGYNGPLPRLVSWSGPVAGSVRVTYDDNLWVTSQLVNGANPILYGHDTDGLLSSAGAMTLTRDAQSGLLTGTTLGSITDTRIYNGIGELKSLTYSYNGTVLYNESFFRVANGTGQIGTETETIGGVTNNVVYGYDPAGRLISSTRNGVATSFTYDSNSNRLSKVTTAGTLSGTYDAQDRLLSYGNASYTYTPNGELMTKTVGSQITTYTYDALGNLTAVALPNGTQISYLIDPEDRRIGKKGNGTLTSAYLYQGSHIVAQVDAAGNVVSRFVYATGANSPDYMISGGITYRIVSDHLGSPRLIVDSATGAIAQRIDYDRFGAVTNDTNPGFQPFGFAGGMYDPDIHLVRFGVRDYDPTTGRWTARDPILIASGDANFYAYAFSDPLNNVDPSGTDGTPDAGAPTPPSLMDELYHWVAKKCTPDPKIEKRNRAMKEYQLLMKDEKKNVPAVENLGESLVGKGIRKGVWDKTSNALQGKDSQCDTCEQRPQRPPPRPPLPRDQYPDGRSAY
jgi:RHS repeat-associated protein